MGLLIVLLLLDENRMILKLISNKKLMYIYNSCFTYSFIHLFVHMLKAVHIYVEWFTT